MREILSFPIITDNARKYIPSDVFRVEFPLYAQSIPAIIKPVSTRPIT